MTKIDWVVYGGTFDPPHSGHLLSVEAVCRDLEVSKVYVLPSYAPPIAGAGVKSPKASFEQRVEMTKILFSRSPLSSKIEVSDLEADLPKPSYTLSSIEALMVSSTGQGALMIGDDQLEVLHQWYGIGEILAKVALIVTTRHNDVGDLLEKFANNMNDELLRDGEILYLRKAKTSLFIQKAVSGAASTLIREKRGDDAWVDDDVQSYIEAHDLYK